MRQDPNKKTTEELSPTDFFRKVWKYKFLYLLSLPLFIAAGLAYIKWVPPVYEADTSILLDTKGSKRSLGESVYLEGPVRLFETEKNLHNEMSLLKSVGLLEQTASQLGFEVSYHSKEMLILREHYSDFPYRVELLPDGNQLINTPIYIEPVSENAFRVRVEEKKYEILYKQDGRVEKKEFPLHFLNEHEYGKPAENELYHFIVYKNDQYQDKGEFYGKPLYFETHHLDDLVREYQNKLTVTQTELQASILNISTEGEVLEKEVAFLDRLTQNYIQKKMDERNQVATGKVSFIEQQLSSIADSLALAERTLERFRISSDAVNLTQTGANALEEYQQLEISNSQAQLNLQYYESLFKYVKDSNGINHMVAPSIVGINDPLLNENLLELKKLGSELSRLRFLKGPKSYDVSVVENQIQTTRASLEENLKNLIASTRLVMQGNDGRRANLERTINLLPTQEKNLVNYQRKTKLFENLYNYLSQELAKTNIAQAENLPDITVINRARMLGSRPKVPQKELILLLSFLIGLMIPSIFVYLKPDSDGAIDGIETIEHYSSLPVLAQIAHDPTAKKRDSIFADHWQTKESIRDLHANIKFFLPNYWKKVIAVTSSVPGEGKSFVAANLAMTMASAGNSVLIIDADFRNPTLSRHLGVNPTKNFSTYLNGWTDNIHEIIKTHPKYNKLNFISTTAASTNPHRYLQNPRFEYTLISLKDEYDHIILDCPAIGLVSDYLLLFHLADIHLFVVRQKMTKRSQLMEIEKFRDKGNIEHLYLALNGVPGKKLKHGYFTYDSSIDAQKNSGGETEKNSGSAFVKTSSN